LDVWLYRTRLIKSRKLAVQMIEKGKVRITQHGETRRITKSGFRLSLKTQISFMRGPTLFQVELTEFPGRRGPAAEARLAYRIIDIQTFDSDPG